MRASLLTLSICLLAVPAQAQYSGGTGTADDPYRIATAADLIALGETPDDYDKHFKLMADIDLSGHVYDRAVIAPDTNDVNYWFEGTPFAGVFDGNGHVVSHLNITGVSFLGLFGQVDIGAELSNLRLEAVDVNGTGAYVGGLAGCNVGAIRTSCSAGTVRGEASVGGLVGSNGTFEYCASSIEYCRSSAEVRGNDCVGGLVGWICDGRVTNSYSTSHVTGIVQAWIGGLIGFSGCDPSFEEIDNMAVRRVFHCYSTGPVNDHEASVGGGGLIGAGEGSVYVSTCFWDIETSDQTDSAGGTGKTTAEMQTASTFLDAGWDFIDETKNGTDDIWWILEGQDYPRLWWELSPDTD